MKILLSISSFKFAQVFTSYISKDSYIEISSQKTFSSKKVTLLKFVILDGVYKQITANKEILSVEH